MAEEAKGVDGTLDTCPYVQELEEMLEARHDWNRRDDDILKARMTSRAKKKTKPYDNAPNPVVSIIDDVVTSKTDQEITMIMNAPRVAYFIPLSQNCTEADRITAEKGFDTFLRHICKYRQKKEQAVDMKNLRGFSITVPTRRDDPRWGVVPDFDTWDCKDWIMPTDLRESTDLELGAAVIRMSPAQLRKRGERDVNPWNKTAIHTVLEKLHPKDDASPHETADSNYDEQSTLKTTEKLIGVNASDYKRGKIVVWAVYHYARKWDVQQDHTKRLKRGRKCIVYICPDVPQVILHAIPWKEPDEMRPLDQGEQLVENMAALKEGRAPKREVLAREGPDMPWRIIQHRYEYRSPYWYDSRGLGQKCMDNQIIATAVKTAKLIWLDHSVNPMYKSDGTVTHQQNIKPVPGSLLPRGVEPATLPQPPPNLDFDIDAEKREAAMRAGSTNSLYSAEVSTRRKIEKTAREVMSDDSKQGLVTSAAVDRFNDPDRELFVCLWDDLKRLRVKLPVIEDNRYVGEMPESIYEYDFLIVPAASEKTLNPDLQFMKDREVLQLAAGLIQLAPNQNVSAALEYVVSHHSPQFARLLFIDPNKAGPQSQPPIYQLLQQIFEVFQQVGQNNQDQDAQLEQVQKLGLANAKRIDGVQSKNGTDFQTARTEGAPAVRG